MLTTRAAVAYTRAAEDEAFIALLRGYHGISQTEMATFFSSFREDYVSDEQRVKLRAIDDVHETSQRLVVRHQTLEAMSGPMSWVRRLVGQIEVIKFAVEWNAMEGKGTNKMKTDFYVEIYLQCPAVAVHREIIKKDARGKLPQEFMQAFRRFRRDKEPSVTGRNHLLDLYNLFGAGVLIEPAFDARILGRSRRFSELLERVHEELVHDLQADIKDKLKELHEATTPVLLDLAQYLGSSQLRGDVSAFIARYPPTFALPAKLK
ncbi:hypothetical protein PsYK624_077810 [Phanerochaete sordida]|uniref:Uncharacterized protein n=1 Tax=Phanerochaete sordida TaxID=48140 RepID=A0A9P3LDL0_9APHY|nr:hypothetical protein PsYK624_077810 [Phanerochaete sordida]